MTHIDLVLCRCDWTKNIGTIYIMAKITSYIPEPKQEYDVNNQRQILESLDNIKQQLNFSFQQDLKNEQDAFNYFLS